MTTALLDEGERLKADAHELLENWRQTYLLRARRALLIVLLEAGKTTIDRVRDLVQLPQGIDPTMFGAVAGPLARAGIIRWVGYAKSSRAIAHSRPLAVWQLADRAAAVAWLVAHPEPSIQTPNATVAAVALDSQRTLF